MKRLLLAMIAFAFGFMLMAAIETARGNEDLVATTPENATYKIQVSFNGYEKVSTGNGTAISPRHILTASHVLSPPSEAAGSTIKEIVVYKPDGTFYWKAKVEEANDWKNPRQDDLALLVQESDEPLAFVPLETNVDLLESEANIVRIIGYAFNQDKLDTKTARLIKNAYILNTYTADTDIDQGISGCGMFSKNDKLMGVVWGKYSETAHAVPLTNIISWQRMKLYQQTPYGTFQSGRYRSFELGFRKKSPPPAMKLQYGPPVQQQPQNMQPQQPNIQQGTPTPTLPNLNRQSSNLQPIPVQTTQMFGGSPCGPGGCGGGGGMMGGGQQQMFMPQQQQMMMQSAQRQYYDPNQSPYATRATPQPQRPLDTTTPAQSQQQVAKNQPTPAKTMQSSPCACDQKALESALNDMACACDQKELDSKLTGVRDELKLLAKKVDEGAKAQPGDKACEEKIQALEANMGDSMGHIVDAVNDLTNRQKELADKIAALGTPKEDTVSTGNNSPPNTDQKPPTEQPKGESGQPELLYLTANNCKECKKSDDLVRQLLRDGTKIRVVVLTARQHTGFNDVPRLTVFKEERKPENYFGASKINGFLASLR